MTQERSSVIETMAKAMINGRLRDMYTRFPEYGPDHRHRENAPKKPSYDDVVCATAAYDAAYPLIRAHVIKELAEAAEDQHYGDFETGRDVGRWLRDRIEVT